MTDHNPIIIDLQKNSSTCFAFPPHLKFYERTQNNTRSSKNGHFKISNKALINFMTLVK